MQQEVARNTVVEAGYSGAKGTHLYDIENINLAGAGQFYLGDPLVSGPQCANTGFINEDTGVDTCLTRPNQQYSNINTRGSLGSSSYAALNLKLQTQNLHNTGLSVIANYTWSHTLDDLSEVFSGDNAAFSLGYTKLPQPGT